MMNANELAKMLFHFWNETEGVEIPATLLDQAATMLREQQRTIDGDKRLIDLLYQKIEQQQAEIEALKCQLAQAQRVYDFDNPLLDKGIRKMNANELIEELEDTGSFFEDALYLKSAALLRQQQAEIEALKDEVAEWKMSYENCHRMCNGYGMN